MTNAEYLAYMKGLEGGSFQETAAKIMAAGAVMGSIQSYNVPIANASCLQIRVLEEMQALMPGRSFYAVYSDGIDGRLWQILTDGKVNAGALARNFGGKGNRKNGSWIQKIGFGHLIVMGPHLLRCMVEHDED